MTIKSKRNQIIKDILYALGAVGIITVAIVAPGAVGAIAKQLGLDKRYSNKQIKRSLLKLEKSKLIGFGQDGGKTVVKLTQKGQEKSLKFKLDDMQINRPKYWDKKWRIVIFDVPHNLHLNRIEFAKKLREIGFKLLQKSVWVCPYPCEEEVAFLKEVYTISQYVRLITANKIDRQNDLIKSFKLI